MKTVEQYLELPYTIVLRRDEDGDIVARVDELPGCSAHGADREEALRNLEEAQRLWISDAIDAGDPVPEPVAEDALPSGKWVQRVPRTLHRKLVQLARRENSSLNQLVTSLLGEAVGQRKQALLGETVGLTNRVEENVFRAYLASAWDPLTGPQRMRIFIDPSNFAQFTGKGALKISGLLGAPSCGMGFHQHWSIEHDPGALESDPGIALLEHMKDKLPNQLTRPLKSEPYAEKKPKAHH